MTSAVNCRLSVALLASGMRAMRRVTRRSPKRSEYDPVAQPTSCYPAGPLGDWPFDAAAWRLAWRWPSFIGAITPSRETAIDTAS
jgi:hypothetical protein